MEKEKKKERFIFRFFRVCLKSRGQARLGLRPPGLWLFPIIPCSCHCAGDFDEKNSAGRSLALGAGSSAPGAL